MSAERIDQSQQTILGGQKDRLQLSMMEFALGGLTAVTEKTLGFPPAVSLAALTTRLGAVIQNYTSKLRITEQDGKPLETISRRDFVIGNWPDLNIRQIIESGGLGYSLARLGTACSSTEPPISPDNEQELSATTIIREGKLIQDSTTVSLEKLGISNSAGWLSFRSEKGNIYDILEIPKPQEIKTLPSDYQFPDNELLFQIPRGQSLNLFSKDKKDKTYPPLLVPEETKNIELMVGSSSVAIALDGLPSTKIIGPGGYRYEAYSAAELLGLEAVRETIGILSGLSLVPFSMVGGYQDAIYGPSAFPVSIKLQSGEIVWTTIRAEQVKVSIYGQDYLKQQLTQQKPQIMQMSESTKGASAEESNSNHSNPFGPERQNPWDPLPEPPKKEDYEKEEEWVEALNHYLCTYRNSKERIAYEGYANREKYAKAMLDYLIEVQGLERTSDVVRITYHSILRPDYWNRWSITGSGG